MFFGTSQNCRNCSQCDRKSRTPTSSGIEAFKDELSKYEGTKGAVKFPISQPLPLELISKIVQFRVTENLNKAAAKAGKKKA